MWYFILFAVAVLSLASFLLHRQYKKPRGDRAHVRRGYLIAVSAVSALGAIEYALWRQILELESHSVILVIHLTFALPTFLALVLIVLSGVMTKRQLRTVRPEYEIYKPLQGERLHKFLVRYFGLFWIATILTGLAYFAIAVKW